MINDCCKYINEHSTYRNKLRLISYHVGLLSRDKYHEGLVRVMYGTTLSKRAKKQNYEDGEFEDCISMFSASGYHSIAMDNMAIKLKYLNENMTTGGKYSDFVSWLEQCKEVFDDAKTEKAYLEWCALLQQVITTQKRRSSLTSAIRNETHLFQKNTPLIDDM
ncbi:regulatory protein RecX [Acrasis kona]|uniref:Regulatory protein RecX n=1 Tax=Acrasis kona TaxID=1008807 RepID=A0AAW2ZFD3_9EUKA